MKIQPRLKEWQDGETGLVCYSFYIYKEEKGFPSSNNIREQVKVNLNGYFYNSATEHSNTECNPYQKMMAVLFQRYSQQQLQNDMFSKRKKLLWLFFIEAEVFHVWQPNLCFLFGLKKNEKVQLSPFQLSL